MQAPLLLLTSLFLTTVSPAVFKPAGGRHQRPLLSSSPSHRFQQISGFISLGDSYSAGIGTRPSTPILDNPCRLGLGAYPHLLAQSLLPTLNISSSSSSFQWLSCTGSTTADLLLSNPTYSQIGTINTSSPASFATLSIGGNDLDFFPLLNACVFRFYGPLGSGTCSDELKRAEDSVFQNSGELELRLRLVLLEILGTIKWERHPGFFVTVTGYARFFNSETRECDGASMAVWAGLPGTELTRETRGRMNGLLLGANRILERVVDGVNRGFGGRAKVVFVDYDEAFEGHRFCEEGVEEPDYGRPETWFFLPGGKDVDGEGREDENSGGEGKGEDGMINEDNALLDPWVCQRLAEASMDWGDRAVCDMVRAKARDPGLKARGEMTVAPGDSMRFTPTYYGKTFHPRSAGHEAIRDRIFKVWEDHGMLKL
ncbi:putative esterase family protein [Cladorrhinum samala]|uniref:Esterase family protein n=1 Tax=Cladorrhinum samala TaxID=585594 RepID=A0AAV9HGN6_9PEZI|nr:putative esterase family protein [Cladorrhinum samala]